MRNDPYRLTPGFYPWRLTIDTRFGDMDPNRHLNNVAITQLYEEARVRFNLMLRGSGAEYGRPSFLVAHVAVDYLAEGQYPGAVEIGFGVLSFGNSSYRAGMGLFQGAHCIGLCDTVMVHRGEGGPTVIPDALRAALGEWAVRR